MGAWLDFVIVGFVALILFSTCVSYEKRVADAPRLLLFGVIAGTLLGLLSDFALRGTCTYVLGYGVPFAILNAATIYGLFVATVLSLPRVRLVRFSLWVLVLAAVYEITNHFFPVWAYTVTPLLGWLSFVVVGYFATAFFVALISHVFGYRFRCIEDLVRQ